MSLSYVLAQPQHDAPERIAYMRCWTAIGPAQTHHVCASCRDSSRFDDVYADFREPDPVFVGGEATDDD